MGIQEGEVVQVSELLYGLMLPSGNDAANVLAEGVVDAMFEKYPANGTEKGPDGVNASYLVEQLGKSEQDIKDKYKLTAFASLMNLRAKNLGCKNTHFVNAHGLHDDEHYTSASDLTLIIGKAYEKKEERRAIKGAAGLTRMVDVSEVTVERKSDGKVKKLVRAAQKREKPAPIDVQAHLRYTRGSVQDFQVVVGDELELSGLKYRVSEITPLEKGAKVTVDAVLTGKKRTLEALEQ